MTISREHMESIYAKRRADDWPLCPACGLDELQSPTSAEATITGCLSCGWRAPTIAEQFRARMAKMTPSEKDAALERLLEVLGPTDEEIMADQFPEPRA